MTLPTKAQIKAALEKSIDDQRAIMGLPSLSAQKRWSQVVEWLRKNGVVVDEGAMDELEQITKG